MARRMLVNGGPHPESSPMRALLTAVLLAAVSAAAATTADHSKFQSLQRSFTSGPEVTRACLECHTDAAAQMQKTKHWTWAYENPQTKQKLGKKTMLNNFCIAIPSNQASCTTCHIGYGWKDASFDFTKQENVDCIVCHDTTGNYRKAPGQGGEAAAGIDLAKVAQKVGKTSRDTCGACHFFGGGGDGVKHGDLDSSMAAPDHALDVHMDAAGLDFTCATCHKGAGHDVAGSRSAMTAKDTKGAHMRGAADNSATTTCASCHGNAPHRQQARLNQHATKLACQACHIPSYARGGVAAKMTWDWSKAGERDAEGKHVVRKDAKGRVTYESRKGEFTYGENVVPAYAWFNGAVTYTLPGDKFEKTSQPLAVSKLGGSATDGKSMIWPVRVFRGVQPYDTVNKTLVTPHTAGNDDTGYWKNLDWSKAIPVGMEDAGAPFSGQYGFVATEMSWPLTHMVAPKDKAVGCLECHTQGGRLAGIDGVYLPARDANRLVDGAGWTLAALALLGVLGHAVMRGVTARRRA
jgi:octaheme c-type cytochrome (tetrathionate reductase family)